MKVYLAAFKLNNKIAYKIGHTKWFKVIKRFEDVQYDIFDDIIILGEILINDPDPVLARKLTRVVEATLQAVYPKNFRLEEHFRMPDNTFNGLSGITEMFITDKDVEEIQSLFERASRNVQQVLNDKRYISE